MSDRSALEFDIHRVERGGTTVLREIRGRCEACSVHAIVRPNGAGKSSLLRALAGLTAYEGFVRLGARDLGRASPEVRARHVAWVPQEPAVPFGVSVRHVVSLARANHAESPARSEEKVLLALERCHVEALAERPFDELSTGQRKLVVIARALATEAKVLLLDEPFSGLDIAASLRVEILLRDLVAAGRIVLVVLHDLAQAASLAERIFVIGNGRLVATGPAAEALAPGVLEAIWGVTPSDERFHSFRLMEPS